MTTYRLDIHIDIQDLKILEESRYKLCIAKKVNGVYSVVWYAVQNLAPNNIFEWVDDYQVFGVNSFQVGALVEATTNSENIWTGQTCVLDQNGVMGSATGVPDSSGRFFIKNDFGPINVGVSSILFGEMRPVFVSPTHFVGVTTLEPVDDIIVWFSPVLTTGTMIFGADASSIEVNYGGGETSKTVKFSNGSWVRE